MPVLCRSCREPIPDGDEVIVNEGGDFGYFYHKHCVGGTMDTENVISRHGAQVRLVQYATKMLEDVYYMEEDTHARNSAILDAVATFGCEVVKMPDDDMWLKRLRLYEKQGHAIDLDKYDLDEQLEREYVFVRYIFLSPDIVLRSCELIGFNMSDAPDIASAIKQLTGER